MYIDMSSELFRPASASSPENSLARPWPSLGRGSRQPAPAPRVGSIRGLMDTAAPDASQLAVRKDSSVEVEAANKAPPAPIEPPAPEGLPAWRVARDARQTHGVTRAFKTMRDMHADHDALLAFDRMDFVCALGGTRRGLRCRRGGEQGRVGLPATALPQIQTQRSRGSRVLRNSRPT